VEGKGKGKGYIIGIEGLRELFYLLSESYKVIAPTLRDGLLVYDHVKDFESLDLGYKNVEGPALYAVEKASNGYLTYTHPANSPKAFFASTGTKAYEGKKVRWGFKLRDGEGRRKVLLF